MAQVPLAVRLSKYGLTEAQVHSSDLNVTANTEQVLRRDNAALAQHVHVVQPHSIDDLKRWFGVPSAPAAPHGPVGHPHGPLGLVKLNLKRGVADFRALADLRHPLPAVLTTQHNTALYAAAHQFIFNDQHGLDAAEVQNLSAWIVRQRPPIIIFHFRDIHVAAGAKLTLGTNNSVLIARYITVENTGRIECKATVTKIDCAGFRGNH